MFYQGFQTRENNRIHELFIKQRLLFFRACKARKTMEIFTVLSALQALENNKRDEVDSQVYSIVLKCLETLVKHKPRVYEITSQLFIVKAELPNCIAVALKTKLFTEAML